MARDISELGADVFDDTVVEKKHRISPKKRNYIIGLSLTGVGLLALAAGYIVLGSTVLKDFDTIPYLEFYYNDADPETGEVTATVACLRKELHQTYPSTFRIPGKINGHRITRIEENAFNDCTLLEKVIMTDNIEYIGAGAFNDCTSLKEFVFSKNLSYIGSKAFAGTVYESSMPEDSTIVLNDQFIIHVGKNAFTTKTVLLEDENSIIPSGYEDCDVKYFTDIAKKPVTGFMDGCFEGNTNLVYVEIPESLSNLPDECFLSCTALKSVDLSKTNISSLSNSAFKYCSSLSSIKLSDNLITEIGSYCFAGTKIEAFPDGLDNLKTVGNGVFEDCTELETFTYPKKLTTIPDDTFNGCESLVDFSFEDNDSSNIVSIGANAFEGTKITSFTVPEKVTSIHGSTFENCTELTTVSMYENPHWDLTPDDLTPATDAEGNIQIDENGYVTYDEASQELLNYYVDLPYAELDDNGEVVLDEDGSICYEYDGELKGVSSIYNSSFKGCSKLTTVSLYGDNGEAIAEKSKTGAIYLPSTLLTTNSNEGSEIGYSFNGTSIEEVYIDSKLASICESCFEDVTTLTKVTFEEGSSLATIGNRAFKGTSISSIDIPDTATQIGVESFKNCSSLSELSLPEKIGDDKSVCTILKGAFEGTTSLKTVNFTNKISKVDERAFANSGITKAIMSDSVGTVGTESFLGCSDLTEVKIPAKTREIGSSAFKDCTSLSIVSLNEGTSKIGTKSFANCTSLESIVIPKSVTTIIANSFEGCTSLQSIFCVSSSAQTGWASGWNQSASIYYYSETEATGCWHYIDGVPTIW